MTNSSLVQELWNNLDSIGVDARVHTLFPFLGIAAEQSRAPLKPLPICKGSRSSWFA